jgi:aminotransferase
MVKEYARRREVLVKGLSEIEGISCLKPEGAFYAFPNVASLGKSSSEIVEYLVTKAGVITASGSDCGKNGEGHIRLAYTIPVNKIEEGIRRIDKAIKLLRY